MKNEPTGLIDSCGTPIRFGDTICMEVEGNVEFHGKHAYYEVIAVGCIPVLSYLRSSKGKMLPEGYLRIALADMYDTKILLWATDPAQVKPMNTMVREND